MDIRPGINKDAVLFYISLVVLAAVSVWPIWATRFLPMQDYPQHLLLAKIIASYQDPSYNWQEFYRIDLGLRPYMLWYLAMRVLGVFVDVETAGKIVFSLYILGIALLVLAARRLATKAGLPWGALLLFPFAFNQMYFLGLPNYVISLPLLFLALLDLDVFAAELSPARCIRHGGYLLLLFLTHPYSLLVYIALSATSACLLKGQRVQQLRTFLPAAVMSLVFAAWYLTQHHASTTPTSVPWSVEWLPPHLSLAFYLLQFTGMRLANGPYWQCVVLWGLIAILFDVAWRRSGAEVQLSKCLVAWFSVSFVAVFVFPFWMGYYSYFSVRLAPVSYFCLALLLCSVKLPTRYAAVVTLSILALLVQSVQLHETLALETEAILPLVPGARQNSLVLPLVYDSDSTAIDGHYFNQIHFHDPAYLQLVVGGGATPTLFPNAMMPVQYQPGVLLPYPKKPADFSWDRHGAYYDYLLVRRAPGPVYRDLARNCDLVARSGPWGLFRNRGARKPL